MIVLNDAKPKYSKLNEILEPLLTNITFTNQVSVVIDIKDVLRKFFRPDIPITENTSLTIEEVASDIINVIGHYRNYFFKNGKRSRFYLLYSEEECREITSQYPDYRYEYYQSRFYSEENAQKINIVKKAIFVISKVCEIIPNVLYINTSDFDELVYFKKIVENTPKNELIFLLSNDYLLYQALDNHTFAITIEGIRSELISKNTAISRILRKDDFSFSANMLGTLFTIAGLQKYNIGNISGFGNIRAATIIDTLLKSKRIFDCPSIEFPIDFHDLDEENKLDAIFLAYEDFIKENYELVTRNLATIKHSHIVDSRIKYISKTGTIGNLFLEINAKIFLRYPLNITMLVKGEIVY